MSTATQPAVLPMTGQKPQPEAMLVLVRGRIQALRRFNGKSHARIVTPAADAYSHPSTVEVRSAQRLGDIGDDVTVQCRLSGFTRKAFKATDRDTGEVVMVTPVDLVLDAIE